MNQILFELAKQQQMPQGQQGQQMPATQPSAATPTMAPNPFDMGIQAAIQSARESLQPTQTQRDRALRNSILHFGENIGKERRGSGFLDNFATIGRAAIPAMLKYGEEEAAAEAQNNQLANQLLAYQGAQQAAQTKGEEAAWRRSHEENKLGEQRRYHDLIGGGRGGATEPKLTAKENEQLRAQEKLGHTFDIARQQIEELGNKGRTGILKSFARKKIGEEIAPLTPEQARIDALDKTIRGQLFKAYGYRAQQEFKMLPSISAANPAKTNLAIIDQLQQVALNLAQDKGESLIDLDNPELIPEEFSEMEMENPAAEIHMRSPDGMIYTVEEKDVPNALEHGYTQVKE